MRSELATPVPRSPRGRKSASRARSRLEPRYRWSSARRSPRSSWPRRYRTPDRYPSRALLDGRAPAEWVMLRGLVRAVARRGDSLLLELQDKGRRMYAAAPLDVDDPCLLGSRVLLQGVSTVAAGAGPHGEQVLLVVPHRFHLRIEETRPARPGRGFSFATHQPGTRAEAAKGRRCSAGLSDPSRRRGHVLRARRPPVHR